MTTTRDRRLLELTRTKLVLLEHTASDPTDLTVVSRRRELEARIAELEERVGTAAEPLVEADFDRPPARPAPGYRPGADFVDWKARASGERDDD